MKTYKEIKAIVDEQEEKDMLEKPNLITDEEWSFYLQMGKLRREKSVLKSQLFDKSRQIEALNTLYGISC